MSGIAGIARGGQRAAVERMLDRLAHRGPAGRRVLELDNVTLGVVWPASQADAETLLVQETTARDGCDDGHLAAAHMNRAGLALVRDPLGLAPLYHGRTSEGAFCFASEAKALLTLTWNVHEFPPAHSCVGDSITPYFILKKPDALTRDTPEFIAQELRRRLALAVEKHLKTETVGCWLSGGLDSSTIAALARPRVKELHTVAVGLEGSEDLAFARQVADFLQTRHHELVVGVDALLAAMPEVIYHLESFDALLVRSSLTNYLAGKVAAEHVAGVFSGEAGDELFAGYDYLKTLPQDQLADELIDITGRLHNTAFQRVDRCSASHGVVAHVPFADPSVVEYALTIPVEYKLRSGIEKWILRFAMDGLLPEPVLRRTKAKFWQGTGLGERLAQYAEERISDRDFYQERLLPNGWTLSSKEELMYYRVFRERLGNVTDLSWMGRTKAAPQP